MKIKEVIAALEHFAPLPLQEGWDNAGLQVGLTEADVSGALLCLDVNEQIVEEAIAKGCNLIVSHHPLIFHKLAHVCGCSYVERAVMNAIRNGIAILSMHTNMDNARGGVNFRMADRLGLKDVEFLLPSETHPGSGSGAVGNLPVPMEAAGFVDFVKETFRVECAQCNRLLERPVQRVALCGGAGAFLLDNALAAGADAFITGEMHYHEFFGHEQDIQIAVIGHYQSEQYTNEIFRDIIISACPGVKCHLAETMTNPISYL